MRCIFFYKSLGKGINEFVKNVKESITFLCFIAFAFLLTSFGKDFQGDPFYAPFCAFMVTKLIKVGDAKVQVKSTQ